MQSYLIMKAIDITMKRKDGWSNVPLALRIFKDIDPLTAKSAGQSQNTTNFQISFCNMLKSKFNSTI